MSDDSDIVNFQRWLQNRLDQLSNIDDLNERTRLEKRIQNAIQECIDYRTSLEVISQVQDPFVVRKNPVRVISQDSISSPTVVDGKCNSCGAVMAEDLQFCPICGKYE